MTNTIDGWMGEDELSWLFEKASTMDSVVEVGCWKGRSTAALAAGCKGKVFAVDHWLGSATERDTAHREAVTADIYAEFLNNMLPFSNVIPVRMPSVTAAAIVDAVDMVFIDAGHEYEEVLADILAWRPKARRLLCGHDYPFERVQRAIHEVFAADAVQTPVGRIWAIQL